MRLKKIFLVLQVLILLSILTTWYVFQPPKGRYDVTMNKYPTNRKPLILVWGGLSARGFTPTEAPPDMCTVTYDQSQIIEADAIVFNKLQALEMAPEMPWKHYRRPDQVYVWRNGLDPAPYLYNTDTLRKFDGGFFNWTDSYTWDDSDVVTCSGYRWTALEAATKGSDVVDEIIKRKTKLAVWIVSDIWRRGAKVRLKFALELDAAGLNFTRYGSYFKDAPVLPRKLNLMKEIIRPHKFFLSFENSLHCRDYITEKFWFNALDCDAVPVVWGPRKEDYLSVAPLDSFIFAEDFETPQKLVEYLKFLDSNDTEYRKYFRWREDKTMTDERMVEMIKKRHPGVKVHTKPLSLCEKLIQRNSNEIKILESPMDSFLSSSATECLSN